MAMALLGNHSLFSCGERRPAFPGPELPSTAVGRVGGAALELACNTESPAVVLTPEEVWDAKYQRLLKEWKVASYLQRAAMKF